MDRRMFCFQCEQTAGGRGCSAAAGVCGKPAPTAHLQDRLTGAMIGLARALQTRNTLASPEVTRLLAEGLFATVTNVNFHDGVLEALIARVHGLSPCEMCDYPMARLWSAEPDARSLRSLLLFGLRGMAAYAYHAIELGYRDGRVETFLIDALAAVGDETLSPHALLRLVLKAGEVNLACMALLDRAHTECFGHPQPTEVSLRIEPGPFIVVSGHDLNDLRRLLAQTEGKGILVYTHGEMLPAHAYPALRRFTHLKGHFGTAWQNQQREFAGLPAPVLFTTNCLMPPRPSYADRLFTTGPVAYPNLPHIGPERDFAPLIKRALALGGYSTPQQGQGLNGGTRLTTGFARQSLLPHIPQIAEALRSGALRHIFLVGGCDGARPGRNYYTDFVKQTPPDTLILTLACGKFRFNDLPLGQAGPFPRLLDLGQCNDAYSAIQVALALAQACDCSVNDLPLSFVLSWYEQKAVCILLTLLHLGIQRILLGPSLPAFLSPNVLQLLVERYAIRPISTPEADLAALLG